ncbi:substrate-specific component FolT of folate ECF transporter [Mycoplasma sp. 'Moose RK']|uniref:substrate-specific component FolT of folate ECF transporter n=1 Tax=Mycoplasma sp. 'Moose RK' TaxID=2780095 RepID=UPI0018C2D1CF|nr:substrate-specific component FolT of folate ECF transporter [Mycoplasma sp. 'Moose RK']MBG0730527.1 substrate-specific component FolT of folate ECF transporter [Mycoplasma sp. 'Moose RK']
MAKLTNMKISFVAIFISIAVIMLIIGVRLAPFAILPNFRLSIIGLPIKITGFIFGPVVGFLTGLLADLLTFLFIPGVYSWYYTIYLSLTGFIPGLFFWFFIKKGEKWFAKDALISRLNQKIFNQKVKIYNYTFYAISANIRDEKQEKNLKKRLFFLQKKVTKIKNWPEEKALLNFYWIASNLILIAVVTTVISIVMFNSSIDFSQSKFISSKLSFVIFVMSGTVTMIFFLVFARFIKFFRKFGRYLTIAPIVAFSALHEPLSSVIAASGDVQSGALNNFETALLTHIITSPVKIWINLSVVYFATRAILPLVQKRFSYSVT